MIPPACSDHQACHPCRQLPPGDLAVCAYLCYRNSATCQSLPMCFSSTCGMAAAFLQPGCLDGAGQLDDRDLALVQRQGDTTDAVAAISTLRGPGIQAELRTDGCIRSTTGDTSGWWLELAKCAPA